MRKRVATCASSRSRPRGWTTYDVKRLGSKFPEGTKMILRDRAYTSPIWYTP